MKLSEDILVAMIFIAIFGIGVFICYKTVQSKEKEEVACINNDKIYSPTMGCESKYDVCLQKLRNTFSDLSDTWGVTTNNQDSISKTIQSEIDRCVANI